MRLIHCADLHLDSNMTTHLSKDKAKERKAELLATFERMVDYAVSEDVQGILISGDLFDKKTISATARKTVYHAIVDHPQIHFYYLQGNHDVTAFVPEGEDIPDNLMLFSDTWQSYCEAKATHSLVISGLELSPSNQSQAAHALTLDHQDFNIVMLHGQEAEHTSKDRAEIIPLRNLRGKGIDYLALGHIHTYKEDKLDARGTYCYPGCLEGRGFDECGEHGFVLLDIDLESGRYTTEFVTFATRNLYTVPVDIQGCLSTAEILKRVRAVCSDEGYDSSSSLRILLQGEVEMDCEKDIDYLLRWLSDEYYFVRIKDETRIRIDYDSYALDESLKGEFVRIVKASDTLSEEDKGQVIQYGIRALAGEEI